MSVGVKRTVVAMVALVGLTGCEATSVKPPDFLNWNGEKQANDTAAETTGSIGGPHDGGYGIGDKGPPAQPVRSTGRSERAIYDAKDGSVTLLGWPQVTQGQNTHIAIEPGVKMVLYRDGRMKTYGSTRTLIQDKTEPNKSQTNVAQ